MRDRLVIWRRVRSASGTNWLWRTNIEQEIWAEYARRIRRANRIDTALTLLGIVAVVAVSLLIGQFVSN